jgi:NADH-quinone oxidoreductase subunit N
LSGLSVIYGALISLYQTSFRRLLGYGSMVHIGLIIFSISIFNPQTIAAGIFYLFIYLLLMFFIFSFMFFLFEKNNEKIYYIDDISQFSLFFANNVLLNIYFALILFSLAGLPFFIGFIAKWYIFIGLIDSFYIFSVLILLSVSILAASYYIRILRFIFFSNKTYKVKRYSIIKFDNAFYNLIVFLFFINIFTALYHSIIFIIILKYILLLF